MPVLKITSKPNSTKLGTMGLHFYCVSHNVCLGLVSTSIRNANLVIAVVNALTADILKAKFKVSE